MKIAGVLQGREAASHWRCRIHLLFTSKIERSILVATTDRATLRLVQCVAWANDTASHRIHVTGTKAIRLAGCMRKKAGERRSGAAQRGMRRTTRHAGATCEYWQNETHMSVSLSYRFKYWVRFLFRISYPQDVPLVLAFFQHRRSFTIPDDIWRKIDSVGGYLSMKEAALLY